MNRQIIAAVSFCVLAGLTIAPAPAGAADPAHLAQDATAPLTAAQRATAVNAVITAVERRYVFPDRVEGIRRRLRASLVSGRYDQEDPAAFAERVSQDLRESSRDGHMYIVHNPTEFAAAVSSGGDAADSPQLKAIWAEDERRANGGLAEMRILTGNVRYLRITQFHWVADRTGFAYDAAMRFLGEGDAVIIDLRGNGGGEHAPVRYLLSHFMEPDRLDMTFEEAGKPPVQSRTLDHLPSGRLTGRPLYVLTDRMVGSAAEAFAYDVKQFHLGVLVGATTAGAANNNEFVPIAPGFMLSLSYGRPVHPVGGSNWEGVGIAPDVAVDPALAQDTAQALALNALLADPDADPAARATWTWALAGVVGRLHPVVIVAERLQALAGTYDGRTIVFEDGGLAWRRSGGQVSILTPMDAEGLFAVQGSNDRLRVRLDGETMEIHRIGAVAPSRFRRD